MIFQIPAGKNGAFGKIERNIIPKVEILKKFTHLNTLDELLTMCQDIYGRNGGTSVNFIISWRSPHFQKILEIIDDEEGHNDIVSNPGIKTADFLVKNIPGFTTSLREYISVLYLPRLSNNIEVSLFGIPIVPCGLLNEPDRSNLSLVTLRTEILPHVTKGGKKRNIKAEFFEFTPLSEIEINQPLLTTTIDSRVCRKIFR